MSRDTARPPYTGAEVAELFNVHPATVIRWADEGKIEAFRTPGGKRRYPRAAVDAMLRDHDKATERAS